MSLKKVLLFMFVFMFISACAPKSEPGPSEEVRVEQATPTPTEMGGGVVITPTKPSSRCAGLSGTLELQILVGPAEAVGLEPVAAGEIPFNVVSDEVPYLVEGTNAISYENVLEAVWGTYSVTFDMDVNLRGECTGSQGGEQLDMVADMSGNQNVVVVSEGFSGEYPWSGTHSLELSFPLEEGATAQGEGWAFVLHLK